MSFRRQITDSAAWVGFSTIIIKVLSFITITLVLARVLDPADFGLVSIAWLAINALEYFREMGIASALTYRQDENDSVASDVAFIALLISSVFTYILIYFAAPWLERFFTDADGLTQVLRVLGLTSLINGVSQVPYTLMAKDLDFRNKSIPEIAAGILNSIVAIVAALAGLGVWALVYGYLADALIRSSTVWFFTTWRPKWRFDRQVWRDMLAYGRHIVGSRVLVFGITNIDDLAVGRLLGTSALGFYTLAYRLSNMPATHITRFVNAIIFPAFSKIQTERERLQRLYFNAIHAVALLSIPLAIGTLFLGPNFVHTYYEGKWDAAIIPMQWLAIYGLIRSIAAVIGNIFRAMGKPHWLTNLALWRLITMALLLYPAIIWGGIIGVSILSAIVAVVDFMIAAWMSERLIKGGYHLYFKHLAPALGVAIVSGIVAVLLLPYIPAPHRMVPFLVAGTIMVLLYSAVSWWIDPLFRQMAISALNRMGPTRRLATRLNA